MAPASTLLTKLAKSGEVTKAERGYQLSDQPKADIVSPVSRERYGYVTYVSRHTAIRASDADRDAVADRLRAATVEGRLDAGELEQRLHVALRARTYGELQQLLDDLPVAPGPWSGRRRGPARPTTAVVLAVRLLAFLVVATVVIALMVLAAASWLIWVVMWFLVCRRSRRCLPPPRRRRRGARPASNYSWT